MVDKAGVGGEKKWISQKWLSNETNKQKDIINILLIAKMLFNDVLHG